MSLIHRSCDVAGFNNERHLESLHEFIVTIPEYSRVLEIGAGFGGSTWEILDSAPLGCEIHTCDTFRMNSPALKELHQSGILAKHSDNPAIVEQMRVYQERGHRAAFDWAIDQHPRHVVVHASDSISFLKANHRWDFVYIDGLHSYDRVLSELLLLRDTPYLCGDDYHPSHPGCRRAIDEVVRCDLDRAFAHDDYESGSGFWSAPKERNA